MSERPFVYFSVFGGLGNQMFQYAAAYAVSKIHNAKLCLKHYDENPHNFMKHNYVKKLFLDASECLEVPGPCQEYRFGNFVAWDPSNIHVPCRLIGHFQFYPALEPFLPEIVRTFRKALNVREKNNTVLLHVRRGDYLHNPHIHYIQEHTYYLAALQHLVDRLQKVPEKILVFSDEIPWCREQRFFQALPNVEFYDNDDEIETLAEMARCGGGAIIANSTFSWWGAILSGTEYVYYPSRWIAENVEDLFPRNWVRI